MAEVISLENFVLKHSPKDSLSRKVLSDIKDIKNSVGSALDTLNEDEKDALIDSHFTSTSLTTQCCNDVPVFPRYRVQCGEKIIVDFDNEGWTWRDEHSGPFSWMTLSQQDLTLEDLDEEIRPKTPTESEQKFKRESANFSSTKPSASTGLSEIEAAFKRFGLKVTNKDDASDSSSPENSPTKTPSSAAVQDMRNAVQPSTGTVFDFSGEFQKPDLNDSLLSKSFTTLTVHSYEETSTGSQSFFPNQSAVEPSTMTMDRGDMGENLGLQDLGPSLISTTSISTSAFQYTTNQSELMAQSDRIPLDKSRSDTIIQSELSTFWLDQIGEENENDRNLQQMTGSSASLSFQKTGFDFLDEW